MTIGQLSANICYGGSNCPFSYN